MMKQSKVLQTDIDWINDIILEDIRSLYENLKNITANKYQRNI